jgi:hypothetical protein
VIFDLLKLKSEILPFSSISKIRDNAGFNSPGLNEQAFSKSLGKIETLPSKSSTSEK